MNKSYKKALFTTLAVGAGALMLVEPSFAQGLNTVTNNVKSQLPGVNDVISGVAYIAGIGFGVKAALSFKEHNESKGQVPISKPITLAVVAALLIALPQFLTTSKESVFGGGATSNTLDGTSTRTIR